MRQFYQLQNFCLSMVENGSIKLKIVWPRPKTYFILSDRTWVISMLIQSPHNCPTGNKLAMYICRVQCVIIFWVFLIPRLFLFLKKFTKIYPVFQQFPKWCPHLLSGEDKSQSTQIPQRHPHEEKCPQLCHKCTQLPKKQRSASCLFTRASGWLVKWTEQSHAWDTTWTLFGLFCFPGLGEN